jgi:hypothetical protein
MDDPESDDESRPSACQFLTDITFTIVPVLDVPELKGREFNIETANFSLNQWRLHYVASHLVDCRIPLCFFLLWLFVG